MATKLAESAQHRSARRFANPSPLFRWAEAAGYLDRGRNSLVFGAGLLAEAEALERLGWRVDALETQESLARREDLYLDFSSRTGNRVLTEIAEARPKYGVVTATHVLEFIESPLVRRRLLRELGQRLSAEGVLLLSLRGWSDVLAAKRRTFRGDGVVTGLGTWTRGFSLPEAEELLGSVGLKIVGGPRTSRSKNPEQVRLLCRPK
jgi:hypothetical protein